MNKLGQLKKKDNTKEKGVKDTVKERKETYSIVDTAFAISIGFIAVMLLMLGWASAWKDSIEEKYEKQFNIADAQYTKLDNERALENKSEKLTGCLVPNLTHIRSLR